MTDQLARPRRLRRAGRPAASGGVPSRVLLVEYANRQAVAVGLVVAATVLAYVSGEAEHVWPYGLIAAALMTQVLLATVALGDDSRRRRLRTSSRPAWFLGSVAVVLAATGLVEWIAGAPVLMSVIATVAAAGLAMSAAPTSLVFAPRG